jgi:hypothetical protein
MPSIPMATVFNVRYGALREHRAVDNFVKNFPEPFYFEYLCLLSGDFLSVLNHSKFNEFKYLNVFP